MKQSERAAFQKVVTYLRSSAKWGRSLSRSEELILIGAALIEEAEARIETNRVLVSPGESGGLLDHPETPRTGTD